jgi:putative dimethyl sulfoxide reductase chaperone
VKLSEHTAGTQWQLILTGELLLFGLLGKLLHTYPDRNLLAMVSEDDFFDDVPFAEGQKAVQHGLSLLQNWSQSQKGLSPDERLSRLQADYTRLFIGPGKVLAPLWESVHYGEERLTFQQETLAVRNWYRRFGLEAVNLHHEPDDHIGLELAFVAHLAGRSLVALEQNDQQTMMALLHAQKQFLSEHLWKWAFGWCALVGEHAQTDFYRGLSQLIEGALLELRERTQVDFPAGVLT